MDTLGIILQIVSIISAGLAAWFWWKSATIKVPQELGVARWGDENDPNPVTPEKRWANETSAANAKGAISAAVSFLAQFLELVLNFAAKWGTTS